MQTVSVVKSATVRGDELVTPKKAEKKGGKRIGYYYIILKSLKESRKNDVVKCFYIKGLTSFGLCVIKEGSYGESKDKEGRDIRDRLKWQEALHMQLQGKVRTPRLLANFEENGNYYLVMEYITGKPLHRMFKNKGITLREHIQKGNRTAVHFMDYLLQVLDILEIMHRHQIVHRDVTPNNFLVTRRGKVAVIDMELSYSLNDNLPSPPFQLGTAGYMSPGQEALLPPTIQDDIFAVGAIMFSAFTGISPSKLTKGSYEEIQRRLHFFITDMQLSVIILQCLHPDPVERPSTGEIKKNILQFRNDLKFHRQRQTQPQAYCLKQEVLDTIQNAIATLASPLLCDPEKGWFAEHLGKQADEKSRINKAWYGSFNRGAAGVIYFLAKAKEAGMDVAVANYAVQTGLELIRERYLDRLTVANPGLHMGSDGVAVALCTALQGRLEGVDPGLGKYIIPLLEKQAATLGIMYGIAGQGMANLLCASFIAPDVLEVRLHNIVTHIIKQQESDGSWNLSGDIKHPRFTRGFANGVAGIIYFLLEFSERNNDAAAGQAAIKGLRWLMDMAIQKNGVLIWKSTDGKDIVPWWSDGATGIALPFIRAYKAYGDDSYKKVATMALQFHPPDIMDGAISQGYGLAGLGEVYMEAFDAFRDDMWQKRAMHVLQVIMHLKRMDAEHGPYWLAEQERQPVANFSCGNAGVLHFLLRSCFPEVVRFPLLP